MEASLYTDGERKADAGSSRHKKYQGAWRWKRMEDIHREERTSHDALVPPLFPQLINTVGEKNNLKS